LEIPTEELTESSILLQLVVKELYKHDIFMGHSRFVEPFMGEGVADFK
jgi:hypothetical protein